MHASVNVDANGVGMDAERADVLAIFFAQLPEGDLTVKREGVGAQDGAP